VDQKLNFQSINDSIKKLASKPNKNFTNEELQMASKYPNK
jgi:hypothetical protein